ncbi:class I SAM-dependent methyltransferase [Candidatus Nomurabacteria bacterium]|nr:class I SAM-dependent methyltransferase [Candidatus Nomurabacteria bacterium]
MLCTTLLVKKRFCIDEKQFKEIGDENYKEHIENDDIVKSKLGNFSDKKVLNIGCGVGRLEECMPPHFGNVYGIDISEVMVEKAKERLSQLHNVVVQATDGVSFPFNDEFFDFIFSYIVFQHMPSKEVVKKNFEEIFRSLKKGGVAKIQIRGGHQPFKWQWFYGPVFKEQEAIDMVKSVGFNVLKTQDPDKKRFWLWLEK